MLEKARVDRGLATKEAARRAGVSDTLWRNLERGYELRKGVQLAISPRPETVVKVARVVGIDTARALELAGLPTAEAAGIDEPDLTGVSDETLLGEVRRRMQLRTRERLSRDDVAEEPARYTPLTVTAPQDPDSAAR